MQIRAARPAEASQLSDLALRSKALWGYSPTFLERCRQELCVAHDAIDSGRVYVAEENGDVIGFYSIQPIDACTMDLGHLFIEPTHVRRGVGKRLLRDAAERCRTLGASALQIQGDPNAIGFYTSCGAALVGEMESDSIPERMLPLFVLSLVH